ncbi:porin [Massilia sp. R2A-15]|uniref:porin n=1 Tax=Massilia sp. R2A-15 TaxID=3064278 RepID=UPI0027334886|nr:porin [Massilia sp. R2A-15]WLI90768.1 porin [Massilia sp. R2A-15]
MKKNIALACALAACSASALAQSTALTIYGDIDAYIGYIRSSSGAHVTGVNDGSILRSRLGFRGAEDLGSGYTAKFNLELGLNEDTGTAADTSRIFDRQAWVGISAPYGEFRIGRQNTEIFLIGGAIDYTERTTFGSIINTFGVPSRYDNDLSYRTPRKGGVQAAVHYALPENGGATRGNKALWQLALDYQNGPYRVGYAGLQASPNEVTATISEKIRYHNVYADYKYGNGTVYAAFVRSNNSTANANGRNAATILSNVGNPNNFFPGTDLNAGRYYNIWQLSADYKIAPQLKIGALYGVMRDTSGGDAGARGGNVGAFYEMSKRTTLYGFASYMKNQANAGFRFSGSAAPSANLVGDDINGRGLTGLQAGILHRF